MPCFRNIHLTRIVFRYHGKPILVIVTDVTCSVLNAELAIPRKQKSLGRIATEAFRSFEYSSGSAFHSVIEPLYPFVSKQFRENCSALFLELLQLISGGLLAILRPAALGGEIVHLGAMGEGALAGGDVFRLAAPCL